MTALGDERIGNLNRLGDHDRHFDGLFLERHLATRDPRDVEHVVDQSRHMTDLALDDAALSDEDVDAT